MKTKLFSILTVVLLLSFVSCNTDNELENNPVKKEVFSGYAQKGPFVNGSSVTIIELDNALNQTGRSYATTIADNSGSFEQKQIELASNYVQLKADGYYFNEVSGKSSSGQLTLFALADISQANSANVNVLTHLEKSRVEYLVQQGTPFSEAKEQAQREVLAIFNLEQPTGVAFETLNLTDNAILLAISCILQGQLSTADMSELMANIITDIRTDGTLDNPGLGSRLLDNARLINTTDIRRNLEAKYVELSGSNIIIPEFEEYVQLFIDNTNYQPNTFITYPATGKFGVNILAEEVTTIKAYSVYNGIDNYYSMKAELPEGTSLKIIIKEGLWYYTALPGPENWRIGVFDGAAQRQEFTVIQNEIPNDLQIRVDPGEITIEYYENGTETPTRVKKVKAEADYVLPPDSSEIKTPLHTIKPF